MNKVFIFLFIFQCTLSAQIHTKSQKFVDVEVGVLDGLSIYRKDNAGRRLGVGISKYSSKGIYYGVVATYNEKFYEPNSQILLVNQLFFLNPMIGKGFGITRKKRIFLNIGGGAFLGYEWINKGRYSLNNDLKIKNRSVMLTGCNFETKIEMFLGIKVSLLFKTGLLWLPTSSVQKIHLNNGFGLRYNYF